MQMKTNWETPEETAKRNPVGDARTRGWSLQSRGLVRTRKAKDGEREPGPRDASMPMLPDRSEDTAVAKGKTK